MAGSGNAAWENLDIFLDTDDFAIHATLHLQAGDERVVRAIFDDPYLNAELGEHELDSTQPRLTCKWVDVQKGYWGLRGGVSDGIEWAANALSGTERHRSDAPVLPPVDRACPDDATEHRDDQCQPAARRGTGAADCAGWRAGRA